jgi:adenylate kinase
MLNLILFGPPGSGKGTQAEKLRDHYNLLHISTGDLLRAELKNETALGLEARKFMDKGELVPDAVMIGMIGNKIDEYAGKVKGIIFDGFPRTQPQADALDQLLAGKDTAITGVIALEVEEEEIVKRILNRGASSGRADDKDEATIRNRFNVYLRDTAPLAEHYRTHGKFSVVEGIGSVEDIFGGLCSAIDQLV